MQYHTLTTMKKNILTLEREGEGKKGGVGGNWEFITVCHEIIRFGRLVFNVWQARFAENEIFLL